MIRALIVDDEKITRKGMISVIPWDRFGIEIVADLGSAAAALSFLEHDSVDLLFVDVAMPGMNGIELIRELRSRGMQCAVVVLSFYDDFQYVQEALRLGAIDYVLKTQLDDQKILQMLDRVTRSMREGGPGAQRVPEDLYCLTPLREGDPCVSAVLEALPREVRETAEAVGSSVLIRLREGLSQAAVAARRAGAALWKPSGRGEPRDLLGRLESRVSRHLFYECAEEAEPCRVDIAALDREEPRSCTGEELAALAQAWSSTTWMLQEKPYQELLERTTALRPPVADLARILDGVRGELSTTFVFLREEPAWRNAEERGSWLRWRAFTQSARDTLRRRVAEKRLSAEIARKVLDAVEIIRQTAGRYGKEESLAARVGLSRSYFSQCFKEITGSEFKRYLVDKSIAEAKNLLARTDDPFRSISAKLGYQNEAYFSRMFRTLTGLSPRDFRARSRSPKESA